LLALPVLLKKEKANEKLPYAMLERAARVAQAKIHGHVTKLFCFATNMNR
jgi:hypothetical protein